MSAAFQLGKSVLLPSDMGLNGALSDQDLVFSSVQHCLLGLQKWFVISDRLEKSLKLIESLEMELVASKAARRLAETSASNSSKALSLAEAKAAAATSRLVASEMELEALRGKLAEMQVSMEESKDAAFEEVEAMYLGQVEQMKALVFKRGYDVGLSDAKVPADSPLWSKHSNQPAPEPDQASLAEVLASNSVEKRSSPVAKNIDASPNADPASSTFDVSKIV